MIGCSLFQPGKDQLGNISRALVEGRHGVRVFGIRAQGICYEHEIFLPAWPEASLLTGWSLFPAAQSQGFLLALGKVCNGSGHCFVVSLGL